ncbi:hypothetical protein KBB96_20035 [Luteolibacter ambystomatis]|uniref:Uncharacterized protein n=1 Tax=Luteolibacter ambystomatis TaxID=2824561 RepID=A0A975G876_9BACT|nr:hypothetical protein [Luteolibacter ambystomatis]QUE51132.1 hypothetical protein KBB96_20035 [Luteolibacter ambystomatis]
MSDPYLPGAPFGQPSPSAFPPPARPAQVRVFGILHLVIACLGVLMVLFSLAMQGMTRTMMENQEKAGGVQELQAKMTRELTEATKSLTYAQHGASIILAVMLVIAGLGLLKWKRSGLKWSNAYAWTSILMKILLIVLMFVVVLPRMNTFFDQLETGAKGDKTMIGVMKATMMGSMVVSPLLYCIYPVLVLILLNRKSVREALS